MAPVDRLPWVTYHNISDDWAEGFGQDMYDLLREVTTAVALADPARMQDVLARVAAFVAEVGPAHETPCGPA